MTFSNSSDTLLTLAEAYFYLGYSVIPLLGDLDPARSKTPALPWAGFQRYCAGLNHYQQWFERDHFAGLGIVTGRVSKLVVLDFDSEAVFNDFRCQYPHLLETHTVRSAGRGLPHLYFKLPDNLFIDTQKGQGVDLLSNGCYVVAPPTTINGQAYQITRGGMPRPLTERDIRHIQSFIKSCRPPQPIPVVSAQAAAVPAVPIKSSSHDLHALYRHLCQRGGRNEALFRTSLFARDTGWQQEEVLNELVTLHSQQPANDASLRETPAHRQHEAQRTITSAFSRPARPRLSTASASKGAEQGRGLPNSVREALMQRKMTYALRTLEGLRLSGFADGQVFSTQQAEETLKGLVGRDSIHKTLQVLAHPEVLASPAAPHANAKAFASSKQRLNNKKCFLLPKKNQEKPHNGRPQHFYRMPSIADLCALLGVSASSSDPLQRADLASAHQTRMALHGELIKRRPDEYSRHWLAARLGVTVPTINLYNRLLPVHTRPTYTETVIRWGNIGRLPFDEALRGAFITDTNGKKYPALRIIASRLLANGEAVCLKEQGRNFYWFGDVEPARKPLPAVKQHPSANPPPAEKFPDKQPLAIQPLVCKPVAPVKQIAPKPAKPAKLPLANFRKPFVDAQREALADHIYTFINGADKKTISRATARRLTVLQPEIRVRAALDQLQQRRNITNPTGFLTILLR